MFNAGLTKEMPTAQRDGLGNKVVAKTASQGLLQGKQCVALRFCGVQLLLLLLR